MSDRNRILIFSGGNLGDWALREINKGDFLLGVDRGAYFLIENGYTPDMVLGDFDSVTDEELASIKLKSKEIYSCDPISKDNTDTDLAMEWAISQKPKEILLLGVTGSRFDHTLANIHLLVKALENNIPCRIKDLNNQIQLIDKEIAVTEGCYDYVSLLPMSEEVLGINLNGFLYPLKDAVLTIGNSLGISNRLVSDEGIISIKAGRLLVIQSRD